MIDRSGPMQKPIPALTGLRFAAAFSVLFAHALSDIFPWPKGAALPNLYTMLEDVSGEGMSFDLLPLNALVFG
jgi:peptidoglycan/LPS O-acetylase OafA/YrhL